MGDWELWGGGRVAGRGREARRRRRKGGKGTLEMKGVSEVREEEGVRKVRWTRRKGGRGTARGRKVRLRGREGERWGRRDMEEHWQTNREAGYHGVKILYGLISSIRPQGVPPPLYPHPHL
jgi:hypothetical protein